MPDTQLHITRLHAKLQQFIKRHYSVVQENETQKKQILALRDTVVAYKEEIETLYQQQLLLKASLDKLEPKEKKDLEQKLNGYIKNIDKCISLLSHKQNT